MGTRAAPRIDPRLRQYIDGADLFASPAEVTRAVGDLAWRLGLTRPSYQQVRVLLGGATRLEPTLPRGTRTIDARVVFQSIDRALWWAADYPGLGLGRNYRRRYPRRT
jgi:hypothetical protein